MNVRQFAPGITACRLLLMAVVAATSALTACGGSSTPSATSTSSAPVLNEAAAQDRIRQYLTETLDALPPGTTLTAAPARADGRTADPDLRDLPAAPCDGDLNNTTGPKKAQVWYWVTGIPAGKTGDYLTSIMRIWRDRLWNVTPIEPDVQANAVTHDGYLLIVARAKANDGTTQDELSLAGTSPCFPNSATGTATPLPTAINQR